jgi:hypothetical protein
VGSKEKDEDNVDVGLEELTALSMALFVNASTRFLYCFWAKSNRVFELNSRYY